MAKKGKNGGDPFDPPKDYDGPDGAARQRAAAANGAGHNSEQAPLGERLAEVAEAIEEKFRELEARAAARKIEDRPLREEIKAIRKAAAEGGMLPAVLNALLRKRRLERQAEEVGEQLNPEQRETLEEYLTALGDFVETPLGAAAAASTAAQRAAKAGRHLQPVS